jgi:hypothetical protein
MRVLHDGEPLWFDLDKGPGPLREIAFHCAAGPDRDKSAVRLEWSRFAVAAACDEPPRPVGDSAQDEVWLASGDQLFGSLAELDAKQIGLEVLGKKRIFSWADCRGVFLRAPAARAVETNGLVVEATLASRCAGPDDVLLGTPLRLDDKSFTLRHAVLGDLVLPRTDLRRIRWPPASK